MYGELLTSPHERRLAYYQARQNFPDIDEELERSRERRRAADEQALRDAEETTQGIMAGAMRPALVAQPAPRQDNSINPGRVVGEALATIGGAVVNRLTQDKPEPPAVAPPPLPSVDLKPPTAFSEGTPPPTLIPSMRPEQSSTPPVDDGARRRMALRPADSSDQLADAHEYTHRRAVESGGEFERPRRFEPAPGSDVGLSSAAARLRPYVRPEDVKPSRNLPAPGEEAANDERVRAMVEESGGVTEGGDAHTRSRVAQPREYLERRIADIEANPTHQNGNSRLAGALKNAARGALQGFARTGSLAGAAGGAITGGVAGAVNKSLDERFDEQDAVARLRPALQGQYEREGARLKLDDARAGVRLENAQAGYAEARPDLEAAKREDVKAKAEQARVFRVLSSLKGQRLDPNDPRVMQLRTDADRAGIPFDVESFNNSKGNIVRYTRTDPAHPEQTVEVERNVVTGQETVLGQRGFQATRNAEGMTTAEVKSDADRDRSFNALERQRSVMNELQRAGFNLSRERFDFAKLERDDRLSEGTRKEVGAAAKMRSEAEQAQMDADSFKGAGMYTGEDGKERQAKWAAQKWKAAEDKAEAKRREYFQAYGYLHAPDGGEMKMTMDEFRQLFPHAPNPSASAPSYGVVLTDSTQPGTPHTNTYPPRRSAPRQPGSTGRTYTEADVRAVARAQGKDEDAAARVAREKGLIQ